MLNSLKTFFKEQKETPHVEKDENKNLILAKTVLFIYVIVADADIDAQEWLEVEHILADNYNMPIEKIAAIKKNAIEKLENATDIHQFCYTVKQHSSRQERIVFIENIMKAAIADGEISFAENHAVWKISELLGIETKERTAIRKKVTQNYI